MLINGDCISEIAKIDKKVDCIICDPPYGTTASNWDNIIDFKLMWELFNNVIKADGTIVIFGSEPYSSMLRTSNISNYKYDWIWDKGRGYNFFNVKYKPFLSHETISVFSNKTHRYFPVMRAGKSYSRKQGSIGESYGKRNNRVVTENAGFRYPLSVLKFPRVKGDIGDHPNQKPLKLLEYLITTYTEKGDVVLDPTMGSGSTGVACSNLDRAFIGIEKDNCYFKIACEKLNEC